MIVSGTVLFNPTSSANQYDGANRPISNVPIALQEQGDPSVLGATTGVGAVALTDQTGAFRFTNVPEGSYRVVEAWGYPNAIQGTVDYQAAAAVITALPADPDSASVPNPPEGSNRVNSLSPNTLFLTNLTSDRTGLYFLDAPNREEPLELNAYVTVGQNLFQGADFGTVGFLPNGTPVQTSPATPPFPLNTSFQYAPYSWYAPSDGYYSVSNTIDRKSVG